MSEPFLAPALVAFRNEINTQFPDRDTASDGWIGDTSHSARPSDHNPCWACSGRLNAIVRAIDVDIDDRDPARDLRRMILNAAIGDPRVWYVISNSVIYSRTHGWAALRYTGSNPHDKHVHVSLLHGVGEFDASPWFDEPRPRKIKGIPVSLSKVVEQFLAAAEGREVEFNNGVGRIQKVLNRAYDEDLVVDGLAGRSTLNAWGRFERRLRPHAGRPRVPDAKSLAVLSRGRFRIVQ